MYYLLLKVAAESLITMAADPKHLGARIGLTAAAHLGIGAHSSSARPYHRTGRRRLARRPALDCLPTRFLFVCPGALAPLPSPVPGKADRSVSGPGGCRSSLITPRWTSRQPSNSPRRTGKGRMGRLCQAAFWRTRRGALPTSPATPTGSLLPIAG